MKPPVFVLGTPRSGTTLLYHMLLSSGGFAILRSETHVFNMIALRFRNLENPKTKRNLMSVWFRSRFFQLSHLDPDKIQTRLLAECKNAGDFLRIVMESIAHNQGVDRWAECTPDHLLHMHEIKKTIPEALFIHIIRDGRDVALSWNKLGWIRPFPWDTRDSLLVTGLRWQWMVKKGREIGRRIGSNYMEVYFEDLVRSPRVTLGKIGRFIDHDLDFDRIQKTAIGSVSKPNTSFSAEAQIRRFKPVDRWKKHFTKQDLTMFESAVGSLIKDLGYQLATPDKQLSNSFKVKRMELTYNTYYSLKHWIRTRIPLSEFLINIDLLYE